MKNDKIDNLERMLVEIRSDSKESKDTINQCKQLLDD